MIEEIVKEFWEKEIPEVKNREVSLEVETDLVNDIVGIRRAGKTYLMYNTIKKLVEEKGKRSVIYINFENRKLIPLKKEYLNELIEFIHAENLLEEHDKIYLFLDEIQKMDEWERFIRGIYDEFKERIKIFVSGSSSSLLSKDCGELLTGRHLTTEVFPLSFKEFLDFKGFKFKETEKKKARIKKLLGEYLEYGGFPEVVLSEKKEEILNQLFNDLLARDILSRDDVRKEAVLEDLSYYFASNVSNLVSFGKMRDYFKSRGINVSIPTLRNYFRLMKEAFLFFDTKIFSYKVKDQLQYPRKIYSVDNGIANLVGFKFSKDWGKLYENTVAIELFRQDCEVFYWHGRQQKEVDFVIKEGVEIEKLIQVCYNIQNSKGREVKSLIKASEELGCEDLLVITKDYGEEEEIKGKKVKFVPLWKWLIER